MRIYPWLFIVCLWPVGAAGHRQVLPPSVIAQLPAGFSVLTFAAADFDSNRRADFVVVARRNEEQSVIAHGESAPRRPLFVYLQNASGRFDLIGRNDSVVKAADEGGQCDPFEPEQGLAVKGRFFTVQNAVACGEHWTDYITFKYSPETRRFVFHRRIFESWIMNPSTDPDAEALVPGARKVVDASDAAPVSLDDYAAAL